MDTCRPAPDKEAGDADLSLLSYLDCCEKAFLEYQKRVEGADLSATFGYLAMHTPFGGMVKGAHRTSCARSPRRGRPRSRPISTGAYSPASTTASASATSRVPAP